MLTETLARSGLICRSLLHVGLPQIRQSTDLYKRFYFRAARRASHTRYEVLHHIGATKGQELRTPNWKMQTHLGKTLRADELLCLAATYQASGNDQQACLSRGDDSRATRGTKKLICMSLSMPASP